jgi:hypothetical protein
MGVRVGLLLCVLVSGVAGRFVVEQGGLRIRFPVDAKNKYPNGFNVSLANFGAPKYGGQVV